MIYAYDPIDDPDLAAEEEMLAEYEADYINDEPDDFESGDEMEDQWLDSYMEDRIGGGGYEE